MRTLPRAAAPILVCTGVVLPGAVLGGEGASSVTLLRDGVSRHRIVVDAAASPSERHAADELRRHFRASTGVDLPVVEAAAAGEMPAIVVGGGEAARRLRVAPPSCDDGRHGARIRTVPPHVVIAGTREGGTLYGVHRFIERRLGVRWLAPGVTRLPRARDLTLPAIDRVCRPAFAFRDTTYAWPGADGAFRSRLAQNAGRGGADGRYGIQYAFDGRCHSYFRYVSPGEFFDRHPEYFSERGGQRIRTETQLCLSSPDVLEIVTERMLARMRAAPEVRQHNFSQMDYYSYCECADCRRVNEELGTTGGTQFRFVNELARRTSRVFPRKLIGTLAYTFTEEPPRGMEMHPNVAVWLCHMFPSCQTHPVATCPRNADYLRRARIWSRICDHLYIWHYCVDFAHYYNPFPNLRAMAADMRLYRDLGVEGMFLQGMGHSGGGGELSLLRPWYGMRLLQDPSQDPRALVREFLEGHYGPAAGPIGEYLELIHDRVESADIHMHLYSNPAQGHVDDDVLRRSWALFDRAAAAVRDDPDALERVEVARMPLVYASLFPRGGYEIEGGRLRWRGDVGSPLEAASFIARMQAHGFRTIREHEGSPAQLAALAVLFSSRTEVVSLRSAALRVDVVPVLGGRALRIVHAPTGRCVTAHDVRRGLYFPFSGGLEHRVGEAFWSRGWMEPATVTDRGERRLALRTRLPGGIELSKVFSLDAAGEELTTEATVANRGSRPAGARLRSHLELDLGRVRAARVELRDRAGRPVRIRAPQILERRREGIHLTGPDRPDGSWTITGETGLAVTQRFEADALDFAWVYAYPEDLDDLEVELWLPRRELAPGESVTLRESLRVDVARDPGTSVEGTP